MKTTTLHLQPAKFGTVSHGTLRTEDLLNSFANELEWQIRRNGEYFARPEHREFRDKLNTLVGEAQDAWNEDGTTLQDEDAGQEMVSELQDVLSNNFAPIYGYFGAHEGDGSDFGYWVNIDDVKEQVEQQTEPDAAFRGEWLDVNDHGNVTLWVREDNIADAFSKDGYVDREVWAVV